MARRDKPPAQTPRLRNEKGRPVTGDGRTQGKPIRGSEVSFRSAGGSEVGTGGVLGKALRWIGGGAHRGGGSR